MKGLLCPIYQKLHPLFYPIFVRNAQNLSIPRIFLNCSRRHVEAKERCCLLYLFGVTQQLIKITYLLARVPVPSTYASLNNAVGRGKRFVGHLYRDIGLSRARRVLSTLKSDAAED